ncbi:MAG: glycosyltransferase [Sediminibacterium sp.]|nr:glycosyltransferase [Sediminibacterium sp.]MBP6144016.1 glycosyltransferase [Sediminibacterium sp.]
MVDQLIIMGPAWPLRGNLAAFDEKLATCFIESGIQTKLCTFSLQYPGFLFPGTTQYSTDPAPKHLKIEVAMNSVNPFNWIRVGLRIKNERPDLIIVRYWIPFMGPCLGTILSIVKWNKHTKVIAIVDNMIPHEKRWGDNLFTKYFVRGVDGFLTMSNKVQKDVKTFTNKPSCVSPHPIYDHFGEAIPTAEARKLLNLEVNDKVILFFGFVRAYKGLDLLIEAMSDPALKAAGIKLVIAGEFYEAPEPYLAQIEKLGLTDSISVYNQYIGEQEVKLYASAADFIIQPYKNATQSGVTPMAYHFLKPMLVTNVGGLADTVPHDKVGLVVEPNVNAIAKGILQLYERGTAHFMPHLVTEKKKYSWEQMRQSFLTLYQQL